MDTKDTLGADIAEDNLADMEELVEEVPRSGSHGQSGDSQGLSTEPSASDESVEELAEEGQSCEADMIQGAEDAEANPDRPVSSHDERPRSVSKQADSKA